MATVCPFSRLTAPAALEHLQRRGVNIVAPERVDAFGECASKVSEKSAELEDVIACGVADAATGFRCRWSRWNAQLPEDRAMLLAQEIAEFGQPVSDDEPRSEEEDRGAEPPEEEERADAERPAKKKHGEIKWHAVLAKAKHIYEVEYTEDADEPDLKMKQKTAFHQHLMHMLLDVASSAVRGRTRNASGFVVETVRYLLQKLKLFSVTA
jgi:hypothetical protein